MQEEDVPGAASLVLMGFRSDILREEVGFLGGRRVREAETGRWGMGEMGMKRDLEWSGLGWIMRGRRVESMGIEVATWGKGGMKGGDSLGLYLGSIAD